MAVAHGTTHDIVGCGHVGHSTIRNAALTTHTDTVEVGCALQVRIDGREPLPVARLEDGFYVMDDTCTHGAASMSEGDITGFEIECPFHGGHFDVRTGAVTGLPCTKALTVYPVKVEAGRVCAALGAGHCLDDKQPRA